MTRKGRGRGRGRGASAKKEDAANVGHLPEGSQRPESIAAEHLIDKLSIQESSKQGNPKGRGRGRLSPSDISPEIKKRAEQRDLIHPQQFEDQIQPSTSVSSIKSSSQPISPEILPAEKSENLNKVSLISSTVDASNMAVRPGRGTQGRPINLVSNYYLMRYKENDIFHYDVEIKSLIQKQKSLPSSRAESAKAKEPTNIEKQLNRSIGKAKCQEIIAKLIQSKSLEHFKPVYDGSKNIYTSSPLPIPRKQSVVVTLKFAGKNRDYEVIIQPVEKEDGSNMINLKRIRDMEPGNPNRDKIPQEILTALNTIMNHRENTSTQIQVGRSFFFLDQKESISLGDGKEIWHGLNQSIHFTERGPALLLNLSAKAFHKAGPAISYANDVLRIDIRRQSLNHHQIKKLSTEMKGLKVEVTHLPYARKYTVQGVSLSSARNLLLDINGSQVSIEQYFQQRYKALNFPNLPCLHMRSNNNQTYVPLENCNIVPGQPQLGRLSSFATRKMIKETAIPAQARFDNIAKNAEVVRRESGAQMKNFNISMELRPMKVKGRVIEPPLLAYMKSNTRPDMKGMWRMDGNFFFQQSKSNSWILLSFVEERTCSRNSLDKFSQILTNAARKVGLNFGKLLEIKTHRYDVKLWDALNYAKNSGASFVVAILCKTSDTHCYEELKFISDYHLHMVTQCMDVEVVKKFNDQIASNVCLKINTKLGGVNHILRNKLEIFSRPLIIFGADAVHSPRGSGCPSIAAVVGSLDAFPSKYKLACRVQDNPDGSKISQERILDLRKMVESILVAFYHNTRGKYPEKLIFFRDGVSEGQFPQILENEVRDIQLACESVIGRIIPATFIIVQKRHQTRFRPDDPREGVGRMGNVPPGTTVDTDVTHPRFFDFFLCSHEGIQGTSKPAKYTVLHDDNNFSADDIQNLSYHLCHTYVRCNRSISIPAPVMYADLAAYRAKKYADWHILKTPDGSSNSSDCNNSRLPDHVRDAINKMEAFPVNMFFV